MPPEWQQIRVKLGDLKPWPQNPRQSTKKQAARLLASFDEFGQVQTVAVGPDLEVYDGHQRLSALLTVHGPDYEIDARQSSRPLTDAERRKLVTWLHAGAVGGWDWDVLSSWDAGELIDWGFDSGTLADWKRDVSALDNLLESEKPDPADAEPEIDRAEVLREKWGTERGQLWRIGEHRLLCGDSTVREDVERVMGGEKARQVMTSPPYWVGMEYEYQETKEDVRAFIEGCASAFMPYVDIDKSRVVINTATGSARALKASDPAETWILLDWWRDALAPYGFIIRHIRVWVKPGGFPAPRAPETDVVDQHWEFVATFYNPKGAKRGQNAIGEGWAQMGYWDDFVGDARGAGHVASFPLEMPERILRLYGEAGEVCIEPFAGSGTTLVACENLGRKCRAIEISPAYCAVILERMATAFPEIEIEQLST